MIEKFTLFGLEDFNKEKKIPPPYNKRKRKYHLAFFLIFFCLVISGTKTKPKLYKIAHIILVSDILFIQNNKPIQNQSTYYLISLVMSKLRILNKRFIDFEQICRAAIVTTAAAICLPNFVLVT